MAQLKCVGLPGDWLNGWLAAIGSTVVVPGLRLHWSDDPVPLAVLTIPGQDNVAELVQQHLPTADDVAQFPIARDLAGTERIGLNLNNGQFVERSSIARSSAQSWTLSSLYTDLIWVAKEGPKIEKGPFLTPMQGVDNTMFDRIDKLVDKIEQGAVAATFDGVGQRVQQNGIGFDIGRIGSLADDTEMFVDPVIDVLAFYGLSLFPVRGDGATNVRQRGWGNRRTGPGQFRWAAWQPPLTAAGIDALLDRLYQSPETGPEFTACWELVPYRGRGTNDVTRGFGSKKAR